MYRVFKCLRLLTELLLLPLLFVGDKFATWEIRAENRKRNK